MRKQFLLQNTITTFVVVFSFFLSTFHRFASLRGASFVYSLTMRLWKRQIEINLLDAEQMRKRKKTKIFIR